MSAAIIKKNVKFDFDDFDDGDESQPEPTPAPKTPVPSVHNNNTNNTPKKQASATSTPIIAPAHKKSERFYLVELKGDKQTPAQAMGLSMNDIHAKKGPHEAVTTVDEDAINVFFIMIKNLEMSLKK